MIMEIIASTIHDLFSTTVDVPYMVPTAAPTSILIQNQHRMPYIQQSINSSNDDIVTTTGTQEDISPDHIQQPSIVANSHIPSTEISNIITEAEFSQDINKLIYNITPFIQDLQGEILKKSLLQFVLYYRRFLDILQKIYSETPVFVRELTPLRDVICGIRRYNPR